MSAIQTVRLKFKAILDAIEGVAYELGEDGDEEDYDYCGCDRCHHNSMAFYRS